MVQKTLKIGFVLDDGLDSPDGVQQYILALGAWLNSEGHEVHYLVGQTSRVDIPHLHSLSRNIKVRFNGNRLGTIPLPTNRGKLKRLLNKEQFDVLHVQTPFSPFMGGRLVRSAGPGTVVIGTFHIAPGSPLVTIGNRLLGIWCRRTLKRFDHMLSVSKVAQQFALRTFRIRSDILPNVIDYNRFKNAKSLPKYTDDVRTILFLGRLVPRKGCELLIESLSLLPKVGLPPYRVVICGHGPLKEKLAHRADALGVGDKVTFEGFVSESDKPRYFAAADLTVFPSSGGESFGIVLLEAMASGQSVVLGGSNPGYASVLESQPDLLFNPKDSHILATKMAHYLTHETERKRQAAWGKMYSQTYDVQTVGQQLVAFYTEALRKRRGQ